MNEARHKSWYGHVNVQELGNCLSTRFGSEEFLQYPFFPEFEHVTPSEVDVSDVPDITSLDSGSQTRLVNHEDVIDPKNMPYLRKV